MQVVGKSLDDLLDKLLLYTQISVISRNKTTFFPPTKAGKNSLRKCTFENIFGETTSQNVTLEIIRAVW
jgi:hypothetical protein